MRGTDEAMAHTLSSPGVVAGVPSPGASATTPTLVADQVHLTYPPKSGGTPVIALENVSLTVPKGQFVSIVGASGCGKTSLLNLFAGLLKPTGGTVRVADHKPLVGDRANGYMFARDALLPWRTTVRNVELGLENTKMTAKERRERATELLELVGLHKFADTYPRQLSQGMRQRAALARTLAPDPSVLLMDEPFAALDAQTKLHLQREFLRIWEDAPEDQQQTVVFVTHDLQEALLLADRVVVMLPRPGRIAVDRVVDLPRPRVEQLTEIMFSSEFREFHEELFHLLEGDTEAHSSRAASDAPWSEAGEGASA